MATDVDICNIALARIGHAPDLVTSLAGTDTTSKLCNLFYPIARDSLLHEHQWNFAIKRAALPPSDTEPVFEFTNAYTLPSDYLRIIRTNLEADGAVSGFDWRIEGELLLSNTAPGDKVNISGATQANPVVITTSSAHNFSDGASVYVEDVGGMTQINALAFTVDEPTSTTFELKGINGSAYSAYTSGGTVRQINIEVEYVAKITDTTKFPQWFTDLLAQRIAAEIAPRLTDNANIAAQMWDIYNRKLELQLNRDSVEGVPRDPQSDLWLVARL